MMKKDHKLKPLPKFKTDLEEIKFLNSHDLSKYDLGEEAKGIAKRDRSKQLSLRLKESDIRLAKKIANRKGISYQTLLKMYLHEALKREADQLAS
jgi:predicted DNA binding CopG/RHH family protein